MRAQRPAILTALSAGAGIVVAPLAFGAPAAVAATDCGTGTEVASGICEVSFTAAGDFTFTAPAGVEKVAAVIVAAGGGAVYDADGAYAGGGGEVVFVDQVDITSAVSITVGAGGAASSGYFAEDGGDSVVGSTTALGGYAAPDDAGAQSGNGNLPGAYDGSGNVDTYQTTGGGAGGAGVAACGGGGVGLTASDAAAGDTLFPAVVGEPVFGGGGDCNTATVSTPDIAGTGGYTLNAGDGQAGKDGTVILRWTGGAAVAPLVDTGLGVAALLGVLVVGGVLMVFGSTSVGARRRLAGMAVNHKVSTKLAEISERLDRLESSRNERRRNRRS